MPTILSHGVAALAMTRIYSKGGLPRKLAAIAALCAMSPDADVIGFAFGIHYGDWIGHRGFTHSLVFAAIAGIVVARFAFRETQPRAGIALFFFCVTASHGLLDAMTDGGLGIAFFSPFDLTRYFLPWRPLLVSPIGVDFFSERGLIVLANEAAWILLPSLLVLLLWKEKNGPAEPARS
jgi:inner membrane protein